MSQQGYDINNLFQEAQKRWLKPAEVFFILQNHEKYEIMQKAPQKPTGGSLYLFNKRVLRFFRKDGHNWRKKKDGRTVGEAHERLKVGNVEALNCYYAHGEDNPNFQRRSYWMLDPAYEHIVLVHYREISEGKSTDGSVTESLSSVFTPSPSSFTTKIQGSASIVSDSLEPYHISSSPYSLEVGSDLVSDNSGFDCQEKLIASENNEVSQFLRKLEEQLSLNDDSIKDFNPLGEQQGAADDPNVLAYGSQNSKQDKSANLLYEPGFSVDPQYFDAVVELPMQANNLAFLQDAGDSGAYAPSYQQDCPNPVQSSISWTEDLDSGKTSSANEYQERLQSSIGKQPTMYDDHLDMSKISDASMLLPLEAQTFELPTYSPVRGPQDMNSDYYGFSYGQGQVDWPTELDSSLTVAQQQKFTIREISPEWGYATEATKVIIVGSFLCDPKESSAWRCMFGEIEVPLEIIQEGVIRVEAPSYLPGKVTLCITSGNREACSEIREFEFRTKDSGSSQSTSLEGEIVKSPEELQLLVRFCQLLMSDSSLQQGNHSETRFPVLREFKGEDDLWDHVIESLLVGIGKQSAMVDWVLQQLLKDKLYQWVSSKLKDKQDHSDCSFSKKEQGIIHMVAGLGFEWALSPILALGVSVNFRDNKGWTALHWAARFGREKMVAALLASGALPGAVTDPSSHDPVGQTPAAIASSNGHKGLAGYLSEKALTSHLMSLTLEESELSKDSAEIEAEGTVANVSNTTFVPNEDQASLKEYLAAVRNAAQAAARIQAAFRAHSFRKRQQMESAASAVDEYGIDTNDIQGLSAMSKLTFRNARHYNSAALSIQKKYRGWKGRRDFLALRQKVVKIQAHVRGYQLRKQYKVICWAVGVLDKVVLRWKRKGVGLRGFLNELESIDESDDEDIIKVFRKEKVSGAINQALSRVLSMVDPPEALHQYQRMLEHYRQAKVGLGKQSKAPSASSSLTDMENEEDYLFQ